MGGIEFIPILQHLEENQHLIHRPECKDTLAMTVEFYKKVGFAPPWIGYYAVSGNTILGSAAFKGAPRNNTVEIAYGTQEVFRSKGIGTAIAKALVQLAKDTDPGVRVTARTLPEENHSAKILRKNGFVLLGDVMDEEDGRVWEWEWIP